ncbi:MAG: PAS domain-containing protein [Chloroflexota bacterium]
MSKLEFEICSLIHPEDYEATMEHMRAYLEGRSDEWNVIYRIRRVDGSYAWYHDRGKAIQRDAAGKPLKLIGTVVDVSEIKRLEAELRRQDSEV